jgi:uncharacterized protein
VTRVRFPRALLLLAIPVALLLIPTITSLLTDAWWFQEIGYDVVFTRSLLTKVLLFVGMAGLTALVLGGNLAFAQRGAVPEPVVVRLGDAVQQVDLTGVLRRFTRPVTIVLALVLGLGATALWDTVLQFLERSEFGTTDPIFGRDIGWYVFSLPAITALLGLVRSLVTLSLIVLVPVYFFRGDVVLLPRGLRIEPTAGRHLGILLALWFLTGAASLWFVDSANLLFSDTGPMIGASYTDLNVTLPALRVASLAAVLGAVLVLIGAARAQLGWYGFLGLGVYAVVSVLGRGVAPGLVQKFVVAPTELTRETPYLAHHVDGDATRLGARQRRDARPRRRDQPHHGDAARERRDDRQRAPLGPRPAAAHLQADPGDPHLLRLRLGRRRPVLDRRQYRQVLLSPRELNPASLPTRTFINEHLTFTHGMGLTMSPVNQVTTQGLPVLLIQDLPPPPPGRSRSRARRSTTANWRATTSSPEHQAARVRLSVGGAERLHGPTPAVAASPWATSCDAPCWRCSSAPARSCSPATSPPRAAILYHRNIVTRVRKALPFLSLDRDPYMVVADDGTLKWIQDAYTTTSRYPYSYRSTRQHDLHAEQREGRDRRLRRHAHRVRRDPRRPDHADVGQACFPGVLRPALRACRRT